MNCQEVNNVLYKYIDHELSLPEERSLLQHLDTCPDCADAYEAAFSIDRLLFGAMAPVDPPADLTFRIMEAYDRSLPPLSRWQRILESWRHWRGNLQLRIAAVSVAAMALILFGSSLIKAPVPMIGDSGGQGTQVETVTPVPPQTDTPDVQTSDGTVTTPADSEPDTEEVPEPAKDPAPAVTKPAGSKSGTAKPAANSGEKGVVKLPQAASVENRVGTVEIVPLVEGLRGSATAPVLAADGKTVFYTAVVDNEKQAWSLGLEAGAVPQKIEFTGIPAGEEENLQPQWWPGNIPAAGASSVSFDWSPDKKQLAVNIGASTDGEIKDGVWLIQADGTSPVQIAQAGGGNSLAWSADGSKIAFSDRNGGIYILYVRENVLIQVADETENFRNLGNFLWTPDNKAIVFYGRKVDQPGGSIYRIILP